MRFCGSSADMSVQVKHEAGGSADTFCQLTLSVWHPNLKLHGRDIVARLQACRMLTVPPM